MTLTIADDDARGVTVAGAPLTLAEADDGTTDSVTENEGSYTVVLDSEPTATVTVAITNPDGSPVTLDKTSLTFTAATWDEPQTVTVTATDDSIDNAGRRAHRDAGPRRERRRLRGRREDFEVAVTVTDDDAAPTALTLTVDADTGTNGVQTSVAEGGGAKTARVTATLAGATTFATATTVTVAVGAAADSATEGTDYAAVADQTLTIAAGERSGQAEFTLTPTQDVLAEGAEAISLDGTAAGLTVTGATLSLTDDDGRPHGHHALGRARRRRRGRGRDRGHGDGDGQRRHPLPGGEDGAGHRRRRHRDRRHRLRGGHPLRHHPSGPGPPARRAHSTSRPPRTRWPRAPRPSMSAAPPPASR